MRLLDFITVKKRKIEDGDNDDSNQKGKAVKLDGKRLPFKGEGQQASQSVQCAAPKLTGTSKLPPPTSSAASASSAAPPNPSSCAILKASKIVRRSFQHNWTVGRSWLHYEKSRNLMSCSYCAKFKDRISDGKAKFALSKVDGFIEGTNNFRKSTVVDHGESKSHIRATELYNAEQDIKNEKTKTSLAGKSLLKLKEKERNRLRILFRNAHALCKHNRPMSDYIWMSALDEAKGLDVGPTYRNNKACGMFVDQISQVSIDDIVTMIKESSFFSLTMDGSTDIGTVEQETLFCRIVKGGEINCKFLKIDEPESSCSNHLFELVMGTIDELDLAEAMSTKFVGFGCDGASNMFGNQRGLVTLLKQKYPDTISVHCLAHRLELAYKEAIKSSAAKQYDRLSTMLIGVYYFYKKSSKQRKSLRRTFRALDVKGLIPPRVGGTRWLNHMKRAIDCCIRIYPALVDHLSTESHTNAKAEGLAKLLTNYETVAFMLLIRELLAPLSCLSLWLQKPTATICEVHDISKVTITMIEELKTKNPSDLTELLESEDGMFQGRKLKGATPQLAYKNKFLCSVISCLTERYKDLESPIVRSTRIASTRLWPVPLPHGFGDDEVTTAYNHFQKKFDCDLSQILREWSLFRSLMNQTYGKDISQLTWPNINRAMHGMGVDHALLLIDAMLALTPTSVLNETAFSQMRLIKTERRHRLAGPRLNHIMTIKLDGPSIQEFNPDEAISRWIVTPSGRRRRLNYSRKPGQDQASEQQSQGESSQSQEQTQGESSQSQELSQPEPNSQQAADDQVDPQEGPAQLNAGQQAAGVCDSSDEEDSENSDAGYESYEEQDFAANNNKIMEFRNTL